MAAFAGPSPRSGSPIGRLNSQNHALVPPRSLPDPTDPYVALHLAPHSGLIVSALISHLSTPHNRDPLLPIKLLRSVVFVSSLLSVCPALSCPVVPCLFYLESSSRSFSLLDRGPMYSAKPPELAHQLFLP